MRSYTATVSSSGYTTLVAAPSAGFIRVNGYQIMGKDSDTTVLLASASTAKATVFTPSSGVGGISCPPGKEPYFDCAVGEALRINLSGAGNVAVTVQYAIMG